MAVSYAKVLQAMQTAFTVVGRGTASASRFTAETGVPAVTGGLAAALARGLRPQRAIVAVDVPSLEATTADLLAAGTRAILVEKPAALSPQRVRALAALAVRTEASVFVAYNRRFYASVRRTRDIIASDGGVSSCRFEFTERSTYLARADIDPVVKHHWFYANSTHVLDLAFFLAGAPATLSAMCRGGVEWHPAGAIFAGMGRTAAGAYFSYHADWTGPGRWGVEVVTRNHRLFLQPLETLRAQKLGEMQVEPVPLDDGDDQRFKPGVFRQLQAFLHGTNHADLLPLRVHAERMGVYEAILSGSGDRTMCFDEEQHLRA